MTGQSPHVPMPSWLTAQWREHPERFWLALVIVLGLGLRVVNLGAASYWHDEALNLIKSDHIREYLFRGELESNHPPAFAILVTLWRYLGLGKTEGAMRCLNVVLGLGGVVAMYALGKRLFGPRAGLCAAFLLSISPFHIIHSRDLKEYMVLPLTCIVMMHCLYNATEGNRARQWAFYALMSGLACYSETFAAFTLLAANIWFLIQLRGRWNRLPGWALANIAGALMFVPWLRIMLFKADRILVQTHSWWIPKPDLYKLFFYIKTIAFGYSSLKPHYEIATVVFVLAAAFGMAIAWREDWRKGLLLVMWFGPPIAMVYAVSLHFQSIFLIRTMMPFALPVYLWVGLLISRVPGPTLRGGALFCFALISFCPLRQMYASDFAPHEYPHRPGVHPPVAYKEATEHIIRRWRDGDIVLQTAMSGFLPMYWYGLHEGQYTVVVDSGLLKYLLEGNLPAQSLKEFDSYFPQRLQPIVQGKKRVWLVLSEWEREYLPNNPMAVWRWMDSHYVERDHQSFQGFEVLLYESDAHGRPLHVERRDKDDAATVETLCTGPDEAPYKKWKPDDALRWSPPEERRGDLVLRFAPEGAGESIRLSQLESVRTDPFALENHSKADVTCRIEVLASDVLYEAASLYSMTPESDVWTVSPMYNPSAPPSQYDVNTAKAHIVGAGSSTLNQPIALAPGDYESFIYSCGAPSGTEGMAIGLKVAGVNLAEGVPTDQRAWAGWHWYTGMPFRVAPSAGPTTLRATATATGATPESWFDFGYIAFQERPPVTHAVPRCEFWSATVIIPAGQTRRWTPEMSAQRKRFDVWVFEQGENGRAYRIFREWRAP